MLVLYLLSHELFFFFPVTITFGLEACVCPTAKYSILAGVKQPNAHVELDKDVHPVIRMLLKKACEGQRWRIMGPWNVVNTRPTMTQQFCFFLHNRQIKILILQALFDCFTKKSNVKQMLRATFLLQFLTLSCLVLYHCHLPVV